MKKQISTYISVLAAVAMTAACSGNIDTGGGEDTPDEVTLELKTDRNYIKADGNDAVTLTLYCNGSEVTESFDVYSGTSSVDLKAGNKFVTDKVGTYSLWASYKASQSAAVTVNAIAIDVPETPQDPNPSSYSFAKKVLVTDYTGTGCQYCPYMKQLIHSAMEDKAFAEKVSFVEIHTFNANDPAYFAGPIDDFVNVSSYPTVFMDYAVMFDDYDNKNLFVSTVNSRYGIPASAGIAVNSKLIGNQVVLKAVVKAAESASYRIGAWILEDDIYGVQTGTSDKTLWTHNDCLRVADSRPEGSKTYIGYSLGNLDKGDFADHVLVMDLKTDWNIEKCHAIVFISTADSKGNYSVNNVVECGLDGIVPFQYK